MAAEKAHTPNISVIIPVYNGAAYLNLCLQAVAASDYRSYECIVVNDGSTDGFEKIASEFSVQLLNFPEGPFGPAFARNRGAAIARGSILFFVDADVVLHPRALRLVAKVFQGQPDLAAVFGSYDARPKASGVISQYRNLLHYFVHQNGNPEASTFWAGCGAIRRSVFEKINGFDEKQFTRPSIEDIELGYRLREAGYRIFLDKQLQGTHLKGWKLSTLIRTDIVCRAIPWSRLILETKNLPDDLNLKLGQRVSFFLVALACGFVLGSIVQPSLLLGSAAALLAVAVINRRLYAFFIRQRGVRFALVCFGLHIIYYLYSGLSYVSVWLEYRLRRVAGFLLSVRPQSAKVATAGTMLNKMSRIGTENQTHDPRA
jgi:glycosyltransferase involved in cell wall biosynthesis